MNALDQFAEKNPLATATVGLSGTVFSWLMDNLDIISRGLTVFSQLVGIAIGILSFALLIRRWRAKPPFRERYDDDLDW